MQRADSLEKTLRLGKIEGRRRRGRQMMRWLDGIIVSMDTSLRKFCVIDKEKKVWCAAVHGVTKSQTWLSDWRTTKLKKLKGNWSGRKIYMLWLYCEVLFQGSKKDWVTILKSTYLWFFSTCFLPSGSCFRCYVYLKYIYIYIYI